MRDVDRKVLTFTPDEWSAVMPVSGVQPVLAVETKRPARDLAYPDEWLRGWERALLRWPGAKGAVPLTIDLVTRGPDDELTIHGAYDWHDPQIFLYPDEDRADALCTLIHEYAHAWSPRVRGKHHPAVWRTVYRALVYHLCGFELDEDRVYANVREMVREHPDLKISRRGDSWKSAALDIAVSSIFINERLRIDRVDGPGGHCIRAACGARVHLIDVLDQHASP